MKQYSVVKPINGVRLTDLIYEYRAMLDQHVNFTPYAFKRFQFGEML